MITIFSIADVLSFGYRYIGREYLMAFYLKVRLLVLLLSAKIFSMLGAGLGILSEPRRSKVRLIVLLSNRMTSGIHAHS